ALFAGAGGGILGGHLLGWRTVCAVEFDRYAASVLMARQNDGCLPPFPIWDDVRTFDGRPWRGRVDVVSGGFPCQDISAAGQGAGIDGARSGLWGEMARIVGEVRPRFVLVENSPMLTSRGLGRVLGDLAALGYDARWGVLGACDAGAPHERERMWVVAHAEEVLGDVGYHHATIGMGGKQISESGDGSRSTHVPNANEVRRDRRTWASGIKSRVSESAHGASDVPDADGERQQEQQPAESSAAQHAAVECGDWFQHEPDVGRVAHGVADRVDRIAALGNGQVPAVVRLAWRRVGLMR
ncbi:MAG: DNA cytosine methyltransferase, partial [Gemmatimonadales bacterium]|nr:DNA cytosine methyltransferase [Gemmatimonadales bacterium]